MEIVKKIFSFSAKCYTKIKSGVRDYKKTLPSLDFISTKVMLDRYFHVKRLASIIYDVIIVTSQYAKNIKQYKYQLSFQLHASILRNLQQLSPVLVLLHFKHYHVKKMDFEENTCIPFLLITFFAIQEKIDETHH